MDRAELSNRTWIFTRTQSRTTNALETALPWGPNYYLSIAVFSDEGGRTWNRAAADPRQAEIGEGSGDVSKRMGYDGMLMRSRSTPRRSSSTSPTRSSGTNRAVQLQDGVMEIRTGDGRAGSVEFGFYPVEDNDSAVEITAEVLVKEAQPNGCLIVRIEPSLVSLADRPPDGFDLDTTKWRKYRIVNEGKRLSIFVDGHLKLNAANSEIFRRLVRMAVPAQPHRAPGARRQLLAWQQRLQRMDAIAGWKNRRAGLDAMTRCPSAQL